MAVNQKNQTVNTQYNIVVNEGGKKSNKVLKNISSKYTWGIMGSSGTIEFSIDDDQHIVIYKRDEPFNIRFYVDGQLLFQKDSIIPIGGGSFDFRLNGIDCDFYHMGIGIGVVIKVRIGGIEVFSV